MPVDTVMYDLPPERTGKRNRPKKHGEHLLPEDFEPESPKSGDWKIGVRPVLTRLWGERVVYAFVTLPKSGNGSRRLFFCTRDPENILLNYSRCEDDAIRGYGEENEKFSCRLPATRRAGRLKYHTTKAKHSGHLRNTMYGAGKVLSGW